ncbi:Csf1p [Sugiyamaella lignohabitans]|uniref:Csf1p n=1 Tax=Sugiyamaella lignohabitans TaxID=796027 RepID=A0A167EYD5_9ASCO|nr:Csf1p [Sugiyamaella lignohabitans]ANB14605.1 Csf1p [Sugiyamaella lignohabitans]
MRVPLVHGVSVACWRRGRRPRRARRSGVAFGGVEMSSVSAQFTTVSILNNHEFSWVFIVDWILALVLTIFMIFYFNRAVGWLVSFLARWYLWRAHHAQLEVQSLQVSLLGGRIFFKNLSYVGTNEAICVLEGSFTWRYWLFYTRESLISGFLKDSHKGGSDCEPQDFLGATSDDGAGSGVSGTTATGASSPPNPSPARSSKNRKYPARLVFDVTGVEWFVFNRTPAYDALLDLAKKGSAVNSDQQEQEKQNQGDLDTNHKQNLQNLQKECSGAENTSGTTGPDSLGTVRSSSSASTSSSSSDQSNLTSYDNMMLRMLPLEIRCHNKGAMVIGNKDTSSLLIFHFESGVCSVDAAPPTSDLDKFKVIYKINTVKPILEMRPNVDYKGPDTVGFPSVSPLSILKSMSWQSVLAHLSRLRRSARKKSKKYKKKSKASANKIRGKSKNRTNPRVGRTTSRKTSFADGFGRFMTHRASTIYQTSSSSSSSEQDEEDDYYYDENYHPDENDDNDNDKEKPWRGLARYNIYYGNDNRDVSDDIPLDQLVDEYAKYSVILDAAEGTIAYHYDIPGKVPDGIVPSTDDPLGNGRLENSPGRDPEWGVDMSFTSCTIHYGPWADRQRVFIQNMLFPRSFTNSTPEPVRMKGQDRLGMEFKLFIEFKEDVIIRIPTREASKNQKFYASYKENPTANSLRAFGWLELKARHLSTMSYTGALVANKQGWNNNFRMDLKAPELRTSVNHGLVFSADRHTIQSTMKSPLQWNGIQEWDFRFNSEKVETFFLREHVSLLTDLITDFASGPPVTYNQFVPFRYTIQWHISDYGIYLNVNDKNIINNPSDFDDNTFVSFQGQSVDIDILIPMEQVSSIKNRVDFKIAVSDNSVSKG